MTRKRGPDLPETTFSTDQGLRVLTLNIWFGRAHREQRTAALIDLLLRLDADIVALQEMTVGVLKHLVADQRLSTGYWFSDRAGLSFSRYGVVVLSKVTPNGFDIRPLTSTMDRALVDVRWALPTGTLQLGAVHLESRRPNGAARRVQMAEVTPFLDAGDWTLWVGDFNFCFSFPENDAIPPHFHDVWPLLRGTDPGWTVDTERNSMTALEKQRVKRVRYDRILMAARKPGWRPCAIKLIGDQPLTPDVYVSDHFGLVADFEWAGPR